MTSTRDAANALILQDAFYYTAAVGSTAPTDTTTALDAAWKEAGWLDSDGVTITPTGSTTELKGVTGATLAYIKDGDGAELSFTLLESTDVVDALAYPGGTAVTASGITTNTVKALTAPPELAHLVEEHYSNGSIRRIVVPKGTAIAGARKSVYTDFRKTPMTVSAIQGSDKTLLLDITDNASEAA